MKVRISKNDSWPKYLLGAISIIALFFFLKLLMTDFQIQNLETRILLGVSIVCITSYYLFKKKKIIKYDRKNIYIIHDKNEKCVPLDKIKGIRLTLMKLNNHSTWLIDYINENNEESHVRFIPNLHELEYFKFLKEDLIIHNPKAIIKNEATSFF